MERERIESVQYLEGNEWLFGQSKYLFDYLVLIRPHWGKEWDFYPEVKQHVLDDAPLKAHINHFLNDYQAIADVCGFDMKKNLCTFSNSLYRELLNNANSSNPIEWLSQIMQSILFRILIYGW